MPPSFYYHQFKKTKEQDTSTLRCQGWKLEDFKTFDRKRSSRRNSEGIIQK